MIFDYYELEKGEKYLEEFSKNCVIKVNKIVGKDICNNALNYFLKNESRIISKYQNDSKGLVLDEINNRNFVKYFEYPLSESFEFFGPFVNNKIFNLASKLLDTDVFLRSMEIHTRGPGSTDIPPHQDNGYYGLINSDALTFYIALNKQSADNGGLIYVPNKKGNEFQHISSSSKAFSLSIHPSVLPKNRENFKPQFNIGDCSIHHCHSIHFAEPINNSEYERSIVVRLTFFGVKATKKDGHLDWYLKMLEANRS